MTCPPGCLRIQGHTGFHTTVPAVADREDKADLKADMLALKAEIEADPEFKEWVQKMRIHMGLPWFPHERNPAIDSRLAIQFLSDPSMPKGEAILVNQDGTVACRITGLKED